MSETVIPQVKLLISYDVLPDVQEDYRQFMLGEFVPKARGMGLEMYGVWHTAYGEYPNRLASFVAETMEALETILDSDEWRLLEVKLGRYTANYTTKVVRFRASFQF